MFCENVEGWGALVVDFFQRTQGVWSIDFISWQNAFLEFVSVNFTILSQFQSLLVMQNSERPFSHDFDCRIMELHLPEVRKPSRVSPTMVPVWQLLRTRSQAVFIVIFQIRLFLWVCKPRKFSINLHYKELDWFSVCSMGYCSECSPLVSVIIVL